MSEALLNPENAWIFRITHIDNLPWVLENGLRCRSASASDPNLREIGNQDLITKRKNRSISCGLGGDLADYIPFYFTPWSPMHYNIVTGYLGMPSTPATELVFLVASLRTLAKRSFPFLISDRHAYLEQAKFFGDLGGLASLDWPRLQTRDFRKQHEDPEPFERYQAEALIHRHLPLDALSGVVVRDARARARVAGELRKRGLSLKLEVERSWYFR